MRWGLMLWAFLLANGPAVVRAGDAFDAAQATNWMGLELFRRMAAGGKENLVISPYSIESALALAYVGTAGETRTEMARVLQFPSEDEPLADGFRSLSSALESAPGEICLKVANRLFGQADYPFRPEFLRTENDQFGAGFAPIDFRRDPAGSAAAINHWVADKTHDLIQDVVGRLDPSMRLVLVDALYFRGDWQEPFERESTRPGPFHLEAGGTKTVPLMEEEKYLPEAEKPRCQVIFLPYEGNLGMAVFLPRRGVPLSELIGGIGPRDLEDAAHLHGTDVDLFLPRFRVEGVTMPLREPLEGLGVRRAFDEPRGSADFSRAGPRRPDSYLYLSQVLHKTYVSVDETGTEAAAATGGIVLESFGIIGGRHHPIEFRVDRPFVFAILDPKTGVCLYLGAVSQP